MGWIFGTLTGVLINHKWHESQELKMMTIQAEMTDINRFLMERFGLPKYNDYTYQRKD